MAVPYLGRDLRFAIGEESTWGTEASRTMTIRGKSSTVMARATHEPLPHLVSAASVGAVQSESFEAKERTSGTIEAVAGYAGNGLGLLLKHAMGTVADAGTGPYTHTFTMASTLPTGLSACQQRGTANAEEFYGGKVSKLVLSVEAGKPMFVMADMVFKNAGARAAASPSLPALASFTPVLHNEAGNLAFNSVNYSPRNFKLTIDNGLDSDGVHELGTLYIAEPDRGDYVNVTIECDLVYRTDALYTAHLAKTAANVTLTFTSGSMSLAFTLHNAILEKCEDPISAAGYITQSVRWRGYADASNSGLAIVLTNNTATGIGS
jgi:hypothetical protein